MPVHDLLDLILDVELQFFQPVFLNLVLISQRRLVFDRIDLPLILSMLLSEGLETRRWLASGTP
ncbi:MAG: hypothetical protein QM757_02315 [Paludibaculum sp.]